MKIPLVLLSFERMLLFFKHFENTFEIIKKQWRRFSGSFCFFGRTVLYNFCNENNFPSTLIALGLE